MTAFARHLHKEFGMATTQAQRYADAMDQLYHAHSYADEEHRNLFASKSVQEWLEMFAQIEWEKKNLEQVGKAPA